MSRNPFLPSNLWSEIIQDGCHPPC